MVAPVEHPWRVPLRWDEAAAAAGERHRVLCATMTDVFDDWPVAIVDHKNNVLFVAPGDELRYGPHGAEHLTFDHIRRRLFRLIEATPHLGWLLFTKRLRDAGRIICEALGLDNVSRLAGLAEERFANLWLGATVENADDYHRIADLTALPAAARFLSVEPLLGPVEDMPLAGIDLVVAGGESGPNARPTHPDWLRTLRDRCVDRGVAFFFKQWGTWLPSEREGRGSRWTSPEGEVVAVGDLPRGRSGGKPVKGWWAPHDGGVFYRRVGKKAAGRLLDGREYNELPRAAATRRAEEGRKASGIGAG